MIIVLAKRFVKKCYSLWELEAFLSMGYFEYEILFIFDLSKFQVMKAYSYFQIKKGSLEPMGKQSMSAKKNIKKMKIKESWYKQKGRYVDYGMYKYRYIWKRTCRFWKRLARKMEI